MLGVVAVVSTALSGCGGGRADDGSMGCSTFLSASRDQQLEEISVRAQQLGFDQETFGGADRTLEGVVRACEADRDNQVGGVVGGFVSGLSD